MTDRSIAEHWCWSILINSVFRLRGAILLALVLTSGLIKAQVSQTESAASTQLEDVVVTAQRREQRLQDVPISVTAVSPEALENSNATVLTDLYLAVPSLRTEPGVAGYQTYYIRGLGGVGNGGVGQEPSVAIYVDGFYNTSTYTTNLALQNVERVEVLAGPQGTLFGRNSDAGVIQIVTSEPSKTPVANASVAFENYARVIFSGYQSGPMTPDLTYSVAINTDHQGTGWGQDITTGDSVNKSSFSGVRVKLKYEPSDWFQNTFALDYSDFSSDLGDVGAGIIPGGKLGGNITPAPGLSLYDTQEQVHDPGLSGHTYGFQNTTTYNIGSLTLKNLAQFRTASTYTAVDPGYGPTIFIDVLYDREDRVGTEEFQVSQSGSRFNWVAGLFYLYYDSWYPDLKEFGAVLGDLTYEYSNPQLVQSAAAYSQLDYRIFDGTTLTVGYRYSSDWKQQKWFDFFTTTPGYNVPPTVWQRSSVHESDPSWHFAIEQKLADDVMVYVSDSRGFKSGQLDSDDPPSSSSPPLKAETVDSYEVGLKSEWFGRRLKFNVDGFYEDYRNFQTSIFTNNAAGVLVETPVNANGAYFKGADLEVAATPVASLRLSLSGTYVESKYKQFNDVPVVLFNPATGVGQTEAVNATGLPVPGVRKFSGTAGASYDFAVNNGALTPNVQVYAASGAFAYTNLAAGGLPAAPSLAPQPYTLVNAGLTYRFDEGRWSIRGYSNNIGNRQVGETYGQLLSAVMYPILPPRTYGIRFEHKF